MDIFLLCSLKKVHVESGQQNQLNPHTGWWQWQEGAHDSWCPQLEIAHKHSRRIILVKSRGIFFVGGGGGKVIFCLVPRTLATTLAGGPV